MKPSDSNVHGIGYLGYLSIYREKDRATSILCILPFGLSTLLVTLGNPVTLWARQRCRKIGHIVTRAFLKGGWWSGTTHHEISNMLTRLQISLNELVKTVNLSVFCRWSAVRIFQVAQVNGQFSALLRPLLCKRISGYGPYRASTCWKVI